MSDDRTNPAAPAASAASGAAPAAASRGKPPVKRKKWTGPPPPKASGTIWLVLGAAVLLAVGLVVTLHYVFVPTGPAKVFLDNEFRDQVNEMADFAFRPPRHWKIDDRRERDSYYVMGPKEDGFAPLMIFTSLSAAGKLPSFLEEHKRRIQIEEPSTVFLSEEEDAIDGCRAKRIEYDCDYKADEKGPVVKLRTLQFIIKDNAFPVFYKVTCHVRRDLYERYLPMFEASAHTFRRVELKPKFDPRSLIPQRPVEK